MRPEDGISKRRRGGVQEEGFVPQGSRAPHFREIVGERNLRGVGGSPHASLGLKTLKSTRRAVRRAPGKGQERMGLPSGSAGRAERLSRVLARGSQEAGFVGASRPGPREVKLQRGNDSIRVDIGAALVVVLVSGRLGRRGE